MKKKTTTKPKRVDPLFNNDNMEPLPRELAAALRAARLARKGPGRPSKMTPRRVRRFLAAIGTTARLRACAAFAGFDYSRVLRWMEEGAKEDSPAHYREFRVAVTRAREAAESKLTRVVELQAATDWRAAMALLEARRPKGYAPKMRAKVEHGGTISVKGLAEAFAEFMGDESSEPKGQG